MKPLLTKLRRRIFSRAFTLVEMLTVLSIIVVVLAIVIPVWNTLVGNSTIPNAENLISVTLATARADALYNHQTIGVVFFIDPKTNQSAMAEVQADGPAYQPSTQSPPNSVTPPDSLGSPKTPEAMPNNGFVTPLDLVNYPQTTGSAGPTYVTSFNYYRDIVQLPAGVGVALTNNYYGYTFIPKNTYDQDQPFDRYVRFGAILFDSTGAVISIPFTVPQTRPYTGSTLYLSSPPYAPGASTNQLGLRLGLHTTVNDPDYNNATNTGDIGSRIPHPVPTPAMPTTFLGSPTGNYPMMSQLGLCLYDRNVYLAQRCGNNGQADGDDGAVFDERDFLYCMPTQTPLISPLTTTTFPLPHAKADKYDEEAWIDQNGVPLLVNQFNGELVKVK